MTTYTVRTSRGQQLSRVFTTWGKAIAFASRQSACVVITERDADGQRDYDILGNIISRDGTAIRAAGKVGV